MKKLGRLITAMVTPFDEKGEVDYEQAKKLALALLDSGSDGVVVVGTTGAVIARRKPWKRPKRRSELGLMPVC